MFLINNLISEASLGGHGLVKRILTWSLITGREERGNEDTTTQPAAQGAQSDRSLNNKRNFSGLTAHNEHLETHPQ